MICKITGKEPLRTKRAAKRKAKSIERRRKDKRGSVLGVFKCECGYWHLGRTRPRLKG